jgi:trimeric autotransporter adhesin
MKHYRISILVLVVALLAIAGGRALGQDDEPADIERQSELLEVEPLALESLLGTAITYQGHLRQSGTPVSDNCDFEFRLYDAVSGGAQIGTTQTKSNVAVSGGLFTVADLDFGAGAFNGQARWLAIAVRCPTGAGDYTPLTPRQALTPAPYALALPGFYTQQNATSPNLIGGHISNTVTIGWWGPVFGATISGGGGSSAQRNRVTEVYGTVGGGRGNTAGHFSTVGGGAGNTASEGYGTVGGGASNTAGDWYGTVGGGSDNTTSNFFGTVGGGQSNTASAGHATVGGGWSNTASSQRATIGGGWSNTASGLSSTVGGGQSNTASGSTATVSGGSNNSVSGVMATVGGGSYNRASGTYATVGGGYYNTASGTYATVGGGSGNTASGLSSTVGGGSGNTASGFSATVPGGYGNVAAGDNSFAAGLRAKANNRGCFVWGDNSTVFDVPCDDDNRWVARSSGGVYFYTNSGLFSGVFVGAGGNAWSSVSDRALKENVVPVNGREVLAQLAALPLATWNYLSEDAAVRHMGPMAQDFYATFGLGDSDQHISTIDADGVALAAIQGLHEIVQAQEAEIVTQKAEIAGLEARLAALEKQVNGNQAALPNRFSGWLALALGLGGLAAGLVWNGRQAGRR